MTNPHEAKHIFDAAIAAYGFDDARILLGGVIDSIAFANQALKPLFPLERLAVGVMELIA